MSVSEETQAPKTIVDLLESETARRHIEPFLPNGVSYERAVREVYVASKENPEILLCTPISIVMAVGKALSWDLVIGETVYLMPFNVKISKKDEKPEVWEKRLKAIRDYKGDIELAIRSGVARDIDPQCVYENELPKLTIRQGTNPFVEHYPIRDTKGRGKLVGGYVIVKLSHYNIKVLWMSADEIDDIRQKNSKQWKSGPLPGWYVKKTLVHQVTKLLPRTMKALPQLLEHFKEEEDDLREVPEGLALSAGPMQPIETHSEEREAVPA